jgi:hypothetical protein
VDTFQVILNRLRSTVDIYKSKDRIVPFFAQLTRESYTVENRQVGSGIPLVVEEQPLLSSNNSFENITSDSLMWFITRFII